MTISTAQAQPVTIAQHSAAMVLGLGVTGYSAVRYLLARGLSVSVMDSRLEPALAKRLANEFPQVNCHFGEFDGALLAAQSLIVLSPGITLNQPALRQAKQAGVEIVGDIELFFQENTQPVIAITGSNGKSTVTTLVGAMCAEAGLTPLVAGNIGLPVLDALTDSTVYNVAVLELSSFQLEVTSKVPAIAAAFLNVSADHMDRYDSMGDYILAKARIFRGAEAAIIPRRDVDIKQVANAQSILSFDLDEPSNDNEFGLTKSVWLSKGSQRLMRRADVPLIGLHNIQNVLAAFALVDSLSLPLDSTVAAVKKFSGLAHRMQTVAKANGVVWVNDSKATNIGATATALNSLDTDVVWIAGGQSKGADFSTLRDAINKNIKVLILFGEDALKIELALADCLPTQHVPDMRTAVYAAGAMAKENNVVLFSPACASFDMYQNFEQRGDDFVKHTNAWLAERGAA